MLDSPGGLCYSVSVVRVGDGADAACGGERMKPVVVTRQTVENLLKWYVGNYEGQVVPRPGGGHWIELTIRFPFLETEPADLLTDLMDRRLWRGERRANEQFGHKWYSD